MGGISSTGLISGIDSATLINQLISLSARPRQLAQQRLIQLQTQQAAFLDINSQLNALQTAAGAFRVESLFDAKKATSSLPDVLTATATKDAQPGTYGLLVDRLVTSQQLLSRGFADLDRSEIGATSITLESAAARLDRETMLSELNGGLGVDRGKIIITDDSGGSATIDLSKAVTVNDVLDAINNAGDIEVTASVESGAFVLDGVSSVANASGYTTADSLGIAGSTLTGTLTGSRVYALSADTVLSAINDGNGVDINPNANGSDFKILFDNLGVAESVQVSLGEEVDTDGEVIRPAVTTMGDVVDRINEALADAGKSSRAAIGETGIEFTIAGGEVVTGFFNRDDTDNDGVSDDASEAATNTVRDLGLGRISGGSIVGPDAVVQGDRIFGDMNTVLTRSLGGGRDQFGDGELNFTLRDGTQFDVDIDGAGTVSEIIARINASGGDDLVASLNDAGTGLKLEDRTGGSGNLIVEGSGDPDQDSAVFLGISTGAAGVAESEITGDSAQVQYFSLGTRLDDLNGGDGLGTGSFRITDANGIVSTINLDENTTTVRGLIDLINSRGIAVKARINDTGDGLLLEDTASAGVVAMEVEDVSGSIAARLNIAGEAAGVDDDNFIDGSGETVLEFDGTETLEEIVSAINGADGGARVSIINNGSASRPFQLSIAATDSGRAGRITIDARGFDLGLDTLDAGEDARVFIGTGDPARALLVTSSTNTLDDVISGVNIDLNATSDEFVEVSITGDTAKIEGQIDKLITSFNSLVDRITSQTRFVEDTGERGALLGDTTVLGLSSALYATLNGANQGFDGAGVNRLSQVGITVGTGGKLEFDRDRFRDALASDPEAVNELFTRRTANDRDEVLQTDADGNPTVIVNDRLAVDTYSELGLIPQLEELARRYTSSIDGVLTRRNEAIDTQISTQQDRISSLTAGLDRERARLEAQFVAMERALASLQTQQSALAGLVGLG